MGDDELAVGLSVAPFPAGVALHLRGVRNFWKPADFLFNKGARVVHTVRGQGTVVKLMKDGSTKVKFDNGEVHYYRPASMHKLKLTKLRNASTFIARDRLAGATPSTISDGLHMAQNFVERSVERAAHQTPSIISDGVHMAQNYVKKVEKKVSLETPSIISDGVHSVQNFVKKSVAKVSHHETDHVHELMHVTTKRHERFRAEDIHHRTFALGLHQCVFTSHVREPTNFHRGNLDPELRLPPTYPAERACHVHSFRMLYLTLLRSVEVRHSLIDAAAVSLIAASLCPLVWLGMLQLEESVVKAFLHLLDQYVVLIVEQFRFFPAFLLFGLLGYVVGRWQDWLVNCHTLQARLHDIGLAVGMGVIDTSNSHTRSSLYRLYRYLNVVHAMTYASINKHLPKDLDGYRSLGLLMKTEVDLLRPMGNKTRDTCIAWAGTIVSNLIVETKQMPKASVLDAAVLFNGLRDMCTRHQCAHEPSPPHVAHSS